jgi:hypothetical protein
MIATNVVFFVVVKRNFFQTNFPILVYYLPESLKLTRGYKSIHIISLLNGLCFLLLVNLKQKFIKLMVEPRKHMA